MRKLICFTLLLSGALALAQTVPTCNGFDALGNPAYFASGSTTPVHPCTDYFGVGNYANSPLPSGPIDISATGFTILNGGSSYSAPTVAITDFYGTPGAVPPVSCAATVTSGVIAGITCSDGGSGFVAPVVTITDTTGSGAVVLAKLSAAGPLTGGIHKFLDALPDLKSAIAVPDRTTFPGADYYEIALVQTTWPIHTDLPATTVRGYTQLPTGSTACPTTPVFQYMGPTLVAQKNVPVRLKFTNCLPSGTGGNLFIPLDTTYMGAGMAPDGTPFLQNRGELHLHGGVTPWISDGTPHQWTVPAADFLATTHPRGESVEMVPDMYFVNGQVVPQCSATVTTNCSGGTTAQLPAGATTDPGPGSMTYYYTNQQGARLMFYHDHSYGITRLNVYIGEAAGYLIADAAEETALKAVSVPGTLSNPANLADPANDLAHLVPLVIQDKTFVPNASQLAGTDPTWLWGIAGPPSPTGPVNGSGDFWFPHVYTPNQNPADPGGANGFGRWDYGAWFFPPMNTLTAAGTGPLGPNTAITIPCTSAAFPNQILAPTAADNYLNGCPITPNPSGTPEGFMDTPVLNGKAYPVLHVAPEAYRFRILSVGNDRSLNLQLYVADATGKDVTMLPSVPPATGTVLPLCTQVNTLTQPTLGIGLPKALLDASGNPINATGLPANCWPNYGVGPASAGIPSKQFLWAADGRDGGVPDPRTAGPPFIQIGSEGGLLPAPVVIPSTPVNYEANTRSITITNVSAHGLWLGPAERADVIVDFSAFSGKTLILYNDAPTPAPAFDMRLDYFTGGPDNTGIGGAPSTVPGYGPNTRTLMQIVVNAPSTGAPPFSLATLTNGNAAAPAPANAGLPGIFAATQPAPVVPEPTYPVASGGNAARATYARISDNTITWQPSGQPVSSLALGAGGSGYNAPLVTIAPPCTAPCAGTTATASATVTGGVITGLTLTSGGSGYLTAPSVTIADNPALCGGTSQPVCGTGASATAILTTVYTYDQKAIQELFTLDYGRMNATLGVELPMTNFLTQTTIPFGYADWATEIMQSGQKQIWKITHNGVDTHFVHFHLFNVQVLNRMGWDGTVRPPDQNELGWKETVRMNPLEDIVVAMVPITPVLPFPVPDSIRPQDVTMPVGWVSPGQVGSPWISGIDPANGNQLAGAGTTNALVNFGWEYVWHCHILGHEENDMMRPIIVQVAPAAPSSVVAATNTSGGVTISWTDMSASETSFTVQRDTSTAFLAPVGFTVNGTNGTNFNTIAYGQTITFIDSTLPGAGTYYYRVQAVDNFTQQSPLSPPFQTIAMASAWAGPVPVITKPVASVSPTALNFGNQVIFTTSGPQSVTLFNTGTAPLVLDPTVNPAYGISVTGTNSSDFAIAANTCGVSVAAGSSCSISLTFTPTASGARSAALTIVSNDPANPTLNVTLTGTGVVPLTASPTSLTFPVQTVGTTSSAQVVTITNTGATTLTGLAFTFTGTNAGDYSLSYVTGYCGSLLAGGASCKVGVVFKPAALGTRTATLNISAALGPGPAVALSGTGGAGAASVSPTSLTFAPQTVGTTSTAQVVTVTNTGNTTLTGMNFTFTGTNPTDYSLVYVSNYCGTILAAGASCRVGVAFKPAALGPSSATLNVNVAAPGTGATVALSGTGGAGVTSVSPTSLTFPPQTVGTTSNTQVVTVTNTGNTTLTSMTFTFTGTNATDYSRVYVTGNCGSLLAAGTSCKVGIVFKPAALGPSTATLNVNVAAPGTGATVALSGTGGAGVTSVSPTSLTFPAQTVGTTSTIQVVTVTNTGNTTLTSMTFTFTGTNATDYSRVYVTGNCGSLLAAGTSCKVGIVFKPAAVGPSAATLNISVAAPGTGASVGLSGTGQ